MAEAGVITDYLTALSAQLPAPVMEELADGLDQTCQRCRVRNRIRGWRR